MLFFILLIIFIKVRNILWSLNKYVEEGKRENECKEWFETIPYIWVI